MMSFAVMAIAKATLVCGLAFFLSYVCRRARASIRHLVFALAFAVITVIPGATLVLPVAAITVPTPTMGTRDQIEDSATAQLKLRPTVAVLARPTRLDMAAKYNVTIAQVATAIWFTGVALCLIPVVAGLWQLRQVRKRALPWTDGRSIVQTLACALGVRRRRIDVSVDDGVTGPMTCGVIRPAIILPASAEQWDSAALRCAIKHELEHVARWDFLTLCLSRMICAVYWFHPLVWAAWRQLRLEAERACDDAVLRDTDADDYASLLVTSARRESGRMRAVLAMAGRDDLAARIAAMLDRKQARGPIGRRRATGFIAIAAMAIFGIAPITVVRATPQHHSSIAALKFETVSLTRNRGDDWRTARTHFSDHADGTAGVGPDGRVQWLKATNVTARLLLLSAYGSALNGEHGIGQPHQIDNAPEWIDSDRFDVVAKAPVRAGRKQMNEMMQTLLAERFELVAHIESKDFPIYALVLSRSDGNLGPRIIPSHADCSSKPGASSTCGLSSSAGRLVGRGVTMPQLVKVWPNHLSGAHHVGLDRRLIDATGLSGAFDFTLDWTPDATDIRGADEMRQPFPHRVFAFPIESKAPNFVAALQEQLGLMLENRWAPEPVLVVDRIEPPVEN